MSKYTEAVERGLRGLTAVSTGASPGCETCARNYDYTIKDEDSDEYGEPDMETFERDWQAGKVNDEGGFSWKGCGICDNSLGGNLSIWHGVADADGEIRHFDDACVDCVMYLRGGGIRER